MDGVGWGGMVVMGCMSVREGDVNRDGYVNDGVLRG